MSVASHAGQPALQLHALAGQDTPPVQAPKSHLAEHPQAPAQSILPLQAPLPQVTLHSPEPHEMGWPQELEPLQSRSQRLALLQ